MPKKEKKKEEQVVDPATKLDKRKILGSILKPLQKEFGSGVITTADKARSLEERWSTGSLTLDYLLGGGLLQGRAVQFKGYDNSGKTSACITTVANILAQGGTAAWLKGEDFSRPWARKLGLALPPGPDEKDRADDIMAQLGGDTIDPEQFLFIEGSRAEELLEIALRLFRSGGLDLLVIDSISSLTPQELLKKEMTDGEMRLRKAGMNTRLVERIYSGYGLKFDPATGAVTKEDTGGSNSCAIVIINQLRDRIATMSLPPDALGGWALKYLQRADVLFKSKAVSAGKFPTQKTYGREISIKTTSCQIAPEGRYGDYLLYTEDWEGKRAGEIDRGLEVLALASLHGVVEQAGSWIIYDNQKYHGKAQFLRLLEDDPAILYDIEAKVREFF